jgi:phosphoribosylanthranilate isomerase
MKIKICGITNMDDALLAAELGADALGFIFVKTSPRYIRLSTARKIIQELPPFIVPVGVVADTVHEDILELIDETGICCVQLHGNESPKQLAKFPVPVYKSFRVDKEFNLEILQRYKGSAYLLDTYVDGTLGGTGKTFDWDIAVKAKEFGRIILAGGLTPENIAEAVKKVQPYAVDVNSGVESAPGKKDKNKLEKLFKTMRSLCHEEIKR